MHIANPLYDAVFKYLLQNREVARLMIAKITALEVESVDFCPQEVAVPRPDLAPGEQGQEDPMLTLLRMDFSARIRMANGQYRQVLIEIQKAKAPTVIERFRGYLGQQYASADNHIVDGGVSTAVPIVTIYLLGYDLQLSDEIVIDVSHRAVERRTNKVLGDGHPFIEGTNHRSHIIQISKLRGRRRDDMERFLAIFDQTLVVRSEQNSHKLAIDTATYPQEYHFILRQLHRAIELESVRKYMDGEDQLLKDSLLLSRQLERARQKAVEEGRRADEGERRAKDERRRADEKERRAEEERRRAEEEKQRAEEEMHRAEEVQRQLDREKAVAAEQKIELIKKLKPLGVSDEEIANLSALPLKVVREVLYGSDEREED